MEKKSNLVLVKAASDSIYAGKYFLNNASANVTVGISDANFSKHWSTDKQPVHLLSIKNCDEIFGVIDVDKLATNEILYNDQKRAWWKQGFNKAIELNKDKQFTIEDVMQAFIKGQEGQIDYFSYKSLIQKPKEIEVDVEFQKECNCECHQDPSMTHFMPCCYPGQPLLDSEGCLILKLKTSS